MIWKQYNEVHNIGLNGQPNKKLHKENLNAINRPVNLEQKLGYPVLAKLAMVTKNEKYY